MSIDLNDTESRGRESSNLIQAAQSPRPDANSVKIPEDILVQIFLILAADEKTAYKKNPIFQWNLGSSKTEGSSVTETYRYRWDWDFPDVPGRESSALETYQWDWVCVMEVCSFWGRIARETPELWSYLHRRILYSPKQTERFLRLSKDSDLIVEHQTNWPYIFNKFRTLKIVLKELRRIRHLSVAFKLYEGPELRFFFNQPAPRAKTIKLDLSEYAPRDPRALQDHYFPFPTVSPILQEVDLCSFDLFSNMSRLSGLTNLSLKHCYNFSFLELLQMLELSPKLSSLSIALCDIQHSLISKTVNLPNLIALHLSYEHFSEMYDFLFCVEAPKLKTRTVWCSSILTFDDIARLDVLYKMKLLNVDGSFNKMVLISATEFSFYSNASILRVHTSENPSMDIQFLFDPTNLNLAFQCVVKILGSHPIEGFNISDPEGVLITDSWHTLFRTCVCTRLAHMEIGKSDLEHDDRDDLDDTRLNFLKVLTPVCSGPSGEEHEIPRPALNELVIRVTKRRILGEEKETSLDRFHSVLEEMLKTRSLRGSAVRKLTVMVDSGISPLNDEMIAALSHWVHELKWTYKKD